MNFDELGAALRTERERRGLRIEDVADHLKISARHLRALEEGDAASLPHPAYARGFIRSYASYLGMSPDEIHNALNGVTTPAGAPQAPVQISEPAPRARRKGDGKGGGKGGALFILVLLLMTAAAYAGWRWGVPLLSGLEKPRLAQPAPPLTSARPAPVADAANIPAKGAGGEQPRAVQPAPVSPAQPAPPAAMPGKEEARPAPAQQAPGPVQPEGASAARPRADAATPSATGREEAAPPAPAAATGPDEAAVPGQHKVIITATEECWVHSNADKTDTRQFSLRKGDTFALTFARSLELKLGNAGGVRIRYDGRTMPPAGQSGQVRTLTFPPQDAP